MKNIKLYILGIAASALMISCHPDEFPGVGEREAIVPQLAGTWSLSQVIQRDNDAQRKGYPDFAQVQDVTDDFDFSDFRMTLNTGSAGEPSTFTIVPGDSPNVIGNVTTGTWSVDDPDYPSKIVFTGGDGASIELGSFTNLSNGELNFKLIRYQPKAGKPEAVVTYQYSFTKQN